MVADKNIRAVRTEFRSWLSNLVRIDQWDLDHPSELYSPYSTEDHSKSANTAIEYPVENLEYKREGTNSLSATGKFPYQIVFRYPGHLTFHELPISKLEELVEYVQGMALIQPPGCNISLIEPEAVEAPVNPQREGTDQGDWIIYCNFSFLFKFAINVLKINPEFEPGSLPENPIHIDNLGIKTYRAKTQFDITKSSDYTLDQETNISNNL